ncbi:hypothetical protein, unlikely [Trypanosoma brucei gambiense DAL972]|uniref:Uncharacterized protein n=1 Tax=Trypanosoma brucei gambiense (strain MHOM/CI/86/DAL972) TaxID=679716 RepID=C9ZPR6_TRYB9|nr:hypothetical protein, unlikely [Trypanosoma brucei gambiense DAL972]CBH11394.1 hypothetical protein, unlikely [Trypanosoma brucei gambiense DAL972]|eukprot:XP_011773681.1 hypothetical protein, unlikely [Trypanosoma brucei gambiense DAL972]
MVSLLIICVFTFHKNLHGDVQRINFRFRPYVPLLMCILDSPNNVVHHASPRTSVCTGNQCLVLQLYRLGKESWRIIRHTSSYLVYVNMHTRNLLLWYVMFFFFASLGFLHGSANCDLSARITVRK